MHRGVRRQQNVESRPYSNCVTSTRHQMCGGETLWRIQSVLSNEAPKRNAWYFKNKLKEIQSLYSNEHKGALQNRAGDKATAMAEPELNSHTMCTCLEHEMTRGRRSMTSCPTKGILPSNGDEKDA